MHGIPESERNKTEFMRSLDHAEANFWLYDHVSSMNFAVMASGSGDLKAEDLRYGLDTVQSRHGLARVAIERKYGADPHLCFITDPNAKIPLVIEELSQDWKTKLAKDSIRPFSLGEAPLIRAVFYRSNDGSDWAFAIVFHHSIADGRSGMYFLLDVFEVLSLGRKEHSSSPQILPSLMDLYSAEGRANEEKLKEKPLSLPRFSRKDNELNPEIISFQIESDVLQELIRKGREKGVSLHGILGAAQISSFYNLFGAGTAGVLNLSTPADLRPYLSQSIGDSSLGLYITLLTTQLKFGTSFWSLAKQIKDDLKNRLNRREGRAFYELLPPPEQFLQREDGLRVFSSLMTKTPQTSVLSNVGVLPDYEIPNLRIGEISFTVHPSLTQTLFTTAATFRGRLVININFDSNRWEKSEIRQYVSNFQKVLLKQVS
ncbi:condensation domain protein [Leptospira fainei serovar Hurstbridge str. BUT 6]|uniref:Condensation domain protein n=2 Tax=Leptospira fainei TaxID=48782 RepID=S3UT36_9LEPT|nr:condensation domain protein [Leptospira fainei serovar Hurstbridge str. BUT 6]